MVSWGAREVHLVYGTRGSFEMVLKLAHEYDAMTSVASIMPSVGMDVTMLYYGDDDVVLQFEKDGAERRVKFRRIR